MPDQPNSEARADAGTGADERPPFFKSVNGWIAGLTGLVLALAALFTAFDRLFPGQRTVAAVSSSAATAATPTADASAPSGYTGPGGVTMAWDSDETHWVLTDDGVQYYYEEVVSPDDAQVLAYDKTNHAYLRWPLKGGMAEESKDDKANWAPYLKLYPDQEPGAAAAN
jgi:hypothetical protein